MPYVNIKITDEGVTAAQKKQLIEGATQLLVDVLNKNPATTVVVIDEVNTDNWGVAGEVITERRKQGKQLFKFVMNAQVTVSVYWVMCVDQ